MTPVEWFALFATLIGLLGIYVLYLAKLDIRELQDERRKVTYELMQVSIRWQVDHDRLLDLLSKQRAKRLAERDAAAKEIAELKSGVEDALDLLAQYSALGIDPGATPLPALRDRLSQFGRLMEGEPTGPMDLAERKEWLG